MTTMASEAGGTSQVVPAVCLAAGSLALLLAQVLDPTPADAEAGELMQVAAEQSGRWLAMNLLFVLGAGLLLPGTVAILKVLGGRSRVTSALGAALLVAGLVGMVSWATGNLALRALGLAGARDAMAAALSEDAALTVLEGVWIVGLLGGLLLLAVALLRARRVTKVAPVLIFVFVVVEFLFVGIQLAETAGFIALSAGLWLVAASAARPHRRPEAVPARSGRPA